MSYCFGDPNMVRKPRRGDWSKEDEAELRRLAKSGVGQEAAAITLGRSLRAVRLKCHRLNIRWGGRAPAWTDREIALLRKYAQTHTVEQISAMIGRSVHAIWTRASKSGICLRKHGESHHAARLSTAQIAQIFALKSTGLLCSEIAEKLGVNTRHVYHILNLETRYRESMTLLLEQAP